MAKSIDEHVKAFDWSNVRVGSPELTVAFSDMLEDLKAARAEVERLTKALDRVHVQARATIDRVDAGWLPARFVESERGGEFCVVLGAIFTTLDDAKKGKALP